MLLSAAILALLLFPDSGDTPEWPALTVAIADEDGALHIIGIIPAHPVDEDITGVPMAYANLGAVYHRRGELQLAFDNYQKAIMAANMRSDWRSGEMLALAQANMGGILLGSGNPEDRRIGFLALRDSMRLMPDFGPAAVWLSKALNEDREYAETLNIVDSALTRGFGPAFSQNAGPLYINKGVALCALGFEGQSNINFKYAVLHYTDMPVLNCSPQEEGF